MSNEKKGAWFLKTVQEKRAGMYRVALVMLSRTQDAEDAVSEAVENVYRRLDALKNKEALSAYLMRAVINTCRDMIRKRKREFPVDDFTPYEKGKESDSPIWFYLTGMDKKYALPLVMRFSENMTLREIASALGIPEGTASTRISRGLSILKKQMEGR